MSCSFRENSSHSESVLRQKANLDVRILKAALDRYRRQYLLEKKLKNKLKLSREVAKYKTKFANLELELKKKNYISLKISKQLSVCLQNGLSNYTYELKQLCYCVGLNFSFLL